MHEIQVFKVLLSLKVVNFDTKMYLNFSNFRGRTSAGGGTSLGPKTGTSVRWGDWQNFCRMGGPPPEKNPDLHCMIINLKATLLQILTPYQVQLPSPNPALFYQLVTGCPQFKYLLWEVPEHHDHFKSFAFPRLMNIINVSQ